MRLAACLGLPVDIIEPCGFALDDRRIRRVGMDYIDRLELVRHASWQAYDAGRGAARLVLLTTRGEEGYTGFAFHPDDDILVGRESAGVPDDVRTRADASLRVPMRAGMRSLNVVAAAAMVLGEALRQTDRFPEDRR